MRKTRFSETALNFEVYLGLFLRNPRFLENKKEPQRNCEQFPGSSASRSLICVRKRRKAIITKRPLPNIPTISKKTFRVFIFGEFSNHRGGAKQIITLLYLFAVK